MEWTYIYSFTEGITKIKNISHLILEVTQDGLPFEFTTAWSPIDDPVYQDSTTSSGNPLMPNGIYGVKFDNWADADDGFTLVTDRVPVYGNFYAKDGNNPDVVAWNNALAISGFDSDNPLDFIVRPNGGQGTPPPIPEPATMLLLGTGLICLGSKLRKMKKA